MMGFGGWCCYSWSLACPRFCHGSHWVGRERIVRCPSCLAVYVEITMELLYGMPYLFSMELDGECICLWIHKIFVYRGWISW